MTYMNEQRAERVLAYAELAAAAIAFSIVLLVVWLYIPEWSIKITATLVLAPAGIACLWLLKDKFFPPGSNTWKERAIHIEETDSATLYTLVDKRKSNKH